MQQVLEVLHHPYYSSSKSEIQRRMLETLKAWVDGISPEVKKQTFKALSKVYLLSSLPAIY